MLQAMNFLDVAYYAFFCLLNQAVMVLACLAVLGLSRFGVLPVLLWVGWNVAALRAARRLGWAVALESYAKANMVCFLILAAAAVVLVALVR